MDCFFTKNSTVLDMRQREFNFIFSSMQLKDADNTHSTNDKPLSNPTGNLIQPGKQTVIYIKPQLYTEKEVAGLIQPSIDLEDDNDLIFYPASTTTRRKQYTVLIKKLLEYSDTLKEMPHRHLLNKNSGAGDI